MKRLGAIAAVICAALASTGCSENAVFELTLTLPARPAPDDAGVAPNYAFVQLRRESSGYTFDDPWESPDDLEGFELGTEPQELPVSVLTENFGTSVLGRVRYCVSPRCTTLPADDMAPEQQFRWETPFYALKRTAWQSAPLVVPMRGMPARVDVGRCDIQGCIAGEPSSYCRESDGTHYCE